MVVFVALPATGILSRALSPPRENIHKLFDRRYDGGCRVSRITKCSRKPCTVKELQMAGKYGSA